MKRLLTSLACLAIVLSVTGSALAKSVEIRQKDGTRWRGEISEQVEVVYVQQGVEVKISGELLEAAEHYIIVEGDHAGEIRRQTIFRGDILTVKAASGGDAVPTSRPRRTPKDDDDADTSDDQMGVFLLPLAGMVGETFRHEEIVEIGEEADKYGPGQIIVLLINSNGGLVLENEFIVETIWDLKKRHRVIAWVEKAISAGCATAMVCDEIYFKTEGTAGSVTTIRGQTALSEEEQQDDIDYLVKVALEAGYSEHIARSMKIKRFLCSYDKDPVTGEVTWYGDLSGEFVLSDENHNLTFNSSNAVHCGFAKGVADTEDDLAKLLDMPEWREKSDLGRRIAKDWQDTVERCKKEVPMLLRQKEYKGSAGDAQERLGTLIKINDKVIRWINRCPWPCRMMGLPEAKYFERENDQLRKQLADLRRRDRRGGR